MNAEYYIYQCPHCFSTNRADADPKDGARRECSRCGKSFAIVHYRGIFATMKSVDELEEAKVQIDNALGDSYNPERLASEIMSQVIKSFNFSILGDLAGKNKGEPIEPQQEECSCNYCQTFQLIEQKSIELKRSLTEEEKSPYFYYAEYLDGGGKSSFADWQEHERLISECQKELNKINEKGERVPLQDLTFQQARISMDSDGKITGLVLNSNTPPVWEGRHLDGSYYFKNGMSSPQPWTFAEKTVPQRMEAAAGTYRERNKTYGDSYKRFGSVMALLFPDGLKASSIDDLNRLGVLNMIVSKLIRYTTNFSTGGHFDSAHDMGVYAFMLEELTKENDNGR